MKDYAPLIERAFSSVPSEQSYVVEDLEGRIPDFIRGTYYLNGPAHFSRNGLNYRHWLDGDGMVCALRFEPEQVRFTNRFIKSAKFTAEEAAGRPLFRTFGTKFDSDLLKRKLALESPVNVSVYAFGDSLLAFGEQGLPWKLDPLTLETRGQFNFQGSLNEISPFSAHPKIDRQTGDMYNFGIAYSSNSPFLNLYRFDREARLQYRQRLPLDYACSIHDFGLSQKHVVFYLSPYILDWSVFAQQGGTLMDSLHWEPEKSSRLLIVSRESGEQVAKFTLGSQYCLHFINCFEENDKLYIDVLELERPIYDQYQVVPDLFTDVCEGNPVRFEVDVATGASLKKKTIDYRRAPDFPSIDARRLADFYDEFWMLGISAAGSQGRKFFDQLVHATWSNGNRCDVYQAPTHHYLCGEPIFIPDQLNHEQGAVMCQMFDAEAERFSFAVFSARDIARGPVALIHMKQPINLGFHALFVSS